MFMFYIYIFCFTSACLAETISPLLLNSPESTVLKNKKRYLHHGLQNKIKIKMSWSTYKLQPAVRVEKCDHRSRELVVRGDKKATTLEGFQIRVCFLIKTKIWSEYVSWIKYLQNRLLPGRDRQQTPWTTPRTKHPKNSTSPKELMCLNTNHKLLDNPEDKR